PSCQTNRNQKTPPGVAGVENIRVVKIRPKAIQK
uniref:Rev protein n=1 Tax=Bursaphelenchus xylophilus TaxID=6326 RepID=A0A1I7SK13_BURXY